MWRRSPSSRHRGASSLVTSSVSRPQQPCLRRRSAASRSTAQALPRAVRSSPCPIQSSRSRLAPAFTTRGRSTRRPSPWLIPAQTPTRRHLDRLSRSLLNHRSLRSPRFPCRVRHPRPHPRRQCWSRPPYRQMSTPRLPSPSRTPSPRPRRPIPHPRSNRESRATIVE